MTFYVEQGQISIFRRILIKENVCIILKKLNNNKEIEKIVKKMKQNQINKIVLSKELKKNSELIKILKNYDITIFDGKWLMKYILQDIISYLKKYKQIHEIDEITILVNDLTDEVKENIKQFANIYKKIRIITNHYERFKKLEQELFDINGISIILTNNKRKAMSKSMLIINFDFVEETINRYNIYENAVIINLENKIRINKKRFSGTIISDYEIECEKIGEREISEQNFVAEKQNKFLLKEIFEEIIYSEFEKMPNYNRFIKIQKLIKKYNIEIKQLYGINGIIK